MQSLNTILNTLRRYFGWSDLSETRLSPAHGWLLHDEARPLPADQPLPPPPAAKTEP